MTKQLLTGENQASVTSATEFEQRRKQRAIDLANFLQTLEDALETSGQIDPAAELTVSTAEPAPLSLVDVVDDRLQEDPTYMLPWARQKAKGEQRQTPAVGVEQSTTSLTAKASQKASGGYLLDIATIRQRIQKYYDNPDNSGGDDAA